MALGDNLFSGGSGNFGDSSGGFDWGSLWGDLSKGVNDSSSSSGDGGWMNTLGNWLGKLGGGDSSSGGGGNIYSSLLGGLSGAAEGIISKEAVEEQGKQSRKTLDFQAALQDFYKQKDKVRKRGALDTYGQFSTMDRWAPGAQSAPPIDQSQKPGY